MGANDAAEMLEAAIAECLRLEQALADAQAKLAERDAQTITIPRPHVPFGPIRIPESAADADYLRSAVRGIRYAEGRGRGLFGSNLTNTIVKLLNDAADAVEEKGSNDG